MEQQLVTMSPEASVPLTQSASRVSLTSALSRNPTAASRLIPLRGVVVSSRSEDSAAELAVFSTGVRRPSFRWL